MPHGSTRCPWWAARASGSPIKRASIHGSYLAGLAGIIIARGGHIYEYSDAGEFGDDPLRVTVNGCTVTCEDIVLATHNPLVGIGNAAIGALLQTKLALYSSYVVAGRARSGQLPDALFWDTAHPYHYLRVEPRVDHDLVIFGGEDHKTGQVTDTTACYDRLARSLTTLVPDVVFSHQWSGQVIEALDGLPYIGADRRPPCTRPPGSAGTA